MLFTVKEIKGFKPESKPYIKSEKGPHGKGRLQVKVYPTGRKSYQIQYFIGKIKKFKVLGDVSEMSLADARKAFEDLKPLIAQGINPNERRLKNRKKGITFGDLFNDWLSDRKSKGYKSGDNATQIFLKDSKTIKDLPLADVKIDHILDINARIVRRGTQSVADRLMGIYRSLIEFAFDYNNGPDNRGLPPKYEISTTTNWLQLIPKIKYKAPPGRRYLESEEVYKFWHCEEMPFYLNRYFRLALALAGQRVEQVLHSREHEYRIERKEFIIPKERIKVGIYPEHAVPLSPLAIEIYSEIVSVTNGELLFPKERGPRHEPKTIETLSKAFTRWAKRLDMEHFTPRDLRRTAKTLMGYAKISKDDRDKLQQHLMDDVSAVHYDMYDYWEEKQQAMDTWTEYLLSIVGK